MKKVIQPTIKFAYLNEPDDGERFERACGRIFSGLREEILRKKKLQKGGVLNTKKYVIYAYAPKDLQEREELVDSKITTLKAVAQKENMSVVKTIRDFEGNKEVFKEIWGDVYEKSITGILCDGVGDLAADSSLESLLRKLLFDLEIEIRTPFYLFQKELPGNRCFREIAQEGAKW